jgi:hypothetical protein
MTRATKVDPQLAPLAAALNRYVESGQATDVWYFNGVPYAETPRSLNADDVFSDLIHEDPYGDEAERPHDNSSFRKLLKKHATAIHRDHNIVVTLDRKRVYLERPKKS